MTQLKKRWQIWAVICVRMKCSELDCRKEEFALQVELEFDQIQAFHNSSISISVRVKFILISCSHLPGAIVWKFIWIWAFILGTKCVQNQHQMLTKDDKFVFNQFTLTPGPILLYELCHRRAPTHIYSLFPKHTNEWKNTQKNYLNTGSDWWRTTLMIPICLKKSATDSTV